MFGKTVRQLTCKAKNCNFQCRTETTFEYKAKIFSNICLFSNILCVRTNPF